PDSHWQQEFEDAFEYELTADQKTAIVDIKRDMESPTPMDRLLCGDVGYGKTEVAMRAAFKAVMDGKQVAFLAPTTVLAFQHLKKKVDVLTMSATPIPRTLNMSLVGIRDMSIIETPPKDRLSIQTNVVKFDQQVIGRAIRSEIARGGQVYFVHNRVESIFSIG